MKETKTKNWSEKHIESSWHEWCSYRLSPDGRSIEEPAFALFMDRCLEANTVEEFIDARDKFFGGEDYARDFVRETFDGARRTDNRLEVAAEGRKGRKRKSSIKDRRIREFQKKVRDTFRVLE